MDYFKDTKTQISPCIAAKAKYALKLSNKKSNNLKKCTYEYWCKVIDTFISQNSLSNEVSQNAKNQFKNLIN